MNFVRDAEPSPGCTRACPVNHRYPEATSSRLPQCTLVQCVEDSLVARYSVKQWHECSLHIQLDRHADLKLSTMQRVEIDPGFAAYRELVIALTRCREESYKQALPRAGAGEKPAINSILISCESVHENQLHPENRSEVCEQT